MTRRVLRAGHLFTASLLSAGACPPYLVDHRLEAPDGRRDASVFYSPPDSLHLNAACPGEGYHRFPDRPVKPGTRYRLRFHYLVANGSVGALTVRVNQYHDEANTWRPLHDATQDRPLPVVGRWRAGAIDFVTHPDATTAAVTFAVSSPCDVYEAWVDDVVLKPAGVPDTAGP